MRKGEKEGGKKEGGRERERDPQNCYDEVKRAGLKLRGCPKIGPCSLFHLPWEWELTFLITSLLHWKQEYPSCRKWNGLHIPALGTIYLHRSIQCINSTSVSIMSLGKKWKALFFSLIEFYWWYCGLKSCPKEMVFLDISHIFYRLVAFKLQFPYKSPVILLNSMSGVRPEVLFV